MKMYVKWIIFALIAASTCAGVYFHTLYQERERVESGLRIARVVVDVDAVVRIDASLKDGVAPWEIAQTQEYKRLVSILNQLTEAFTVPVKWSYIVQPTADSSTSQLTVLTITPDKLDASTLPGFKYNIEKYPAMKEALYGKSEIVISDIVWDDQYSIWTRSGFIKMYLGDTFVGVLAVDMESSYIWMNIVNTILLTVIYSTVLILAGMSLMDRYMPSRQELELLDRCADPEEKERC